MASTLASTTVPQNARSTRLADFNQLSSVKTPLSIGTGFGVGKSGWSGNGSIWGGGSRASPFTDGATDILSGESSSHSNQGDTYFEGKTGSGSLLSSSESEGWNSRSNVPWGTSVNITSPSLSKNQNQTISPMRLRNKENQPPVHAPNTGGRDDSAFFTNKHPNLSQVNGSRPQKSFSSASLGGSQRMAENSPFAGYSNARHHEEPRHGVNSSQFSANGITASLQSARQIPGFSQDYFSRTREISSNAPSRNNTQAPLDHQGRPPAPHDYTHFSLTSSSNNFHPPSHSRNSSFRSEAYGSKSQSERQETQLARSFDMMKVEEKQMRPGAPNFQPQAVSQSSLYNLESFYDPVPARTKLHGLQDDHAHMNWAPNNPDGLPELGYHFSTDYHRAASSAEHGTISPSTSDYRRGSNSPFYSTSGTPPAGSDSLRSTSGSGLSSRASNSQIALLDRKLRGLQPYQPEQQYLQHNPLHARIQYSQQHEFLAYPTAMRMSPYAHPYAVPAYPSVQMVAQTPRYPGREHDPSQIIRSPLLEDFRTNNKTNKRYELKDIYNHVVEFSGDQHGSRFIQQKLETANSDEKDQIFAEIQPNSLQLMTDVFGNYVIQKLFEHGNQAQKKTLANQMKGHVMALSTQMYGCRVVQKALEHILTDQQASMVKELEHYVMKCVKDQNGNHVIQKAIERVPGEHIQFIIHAFTNQVPRLAAHPYGCRIIQRMLEHCDEPIRRSILQEMHAAVPALIIDQFGNYVIQHVIENGDHDDKSRIVSIVISQLLVYSKHKFASNVVEKSIEFGPEGQRREMLQLLTRTNEDGDSPVLGLVRDQYGNYVIQKVLGQLKGAEREALINQIKPHLAQLKKFSYGKQVMAIEKVIFDPEADPTLSTSSQSSSLPSTNVSTNASTVEGPITPSHLQTLKSATHPGPHGANLPVTA